LQFLKRFANFAFKEGEIVTSQQKKNKILCFALDFS